MSTKPQKSKSTQDEAPPKKHSRAQALEQKYIDAEGNKFEVKWVPVADLKPHPRNRNVHTDEAIDKMVRQLNNHGWKKPLEISNLSGCLVVGHRRRMAAMKRGDQFVPVIFHDFKTDWEEYSYMTSDNPLGKDSELDMAGINEDVQFFGPDIEIDELMIDDFEATPEDRKGLTEDDNAPPPPKVAKTKPGQIYQLGYHRLMCGDSTNPEHVALLMNGATADLVLTDPPYNVAVNDESEESLDARNRRKDGLKVANDKMSEADFKTFLLSIFKNYLQVMKEGAPIYVFYADSMTIPFMETFMQAGFHFAQNIIWNKQQFVMTRKDYHYKHEPILYGWKLGVAHPWYTDRKQSSVWDFDRPFRSELHPTMKPIAILEYAMKNSSKIGDVVVDLFGGSGSTMIAAEKVNRNCYSMELDPVYCDVIVKRWEEFTGLKAQLNPEQTKLKKKR